MAADIDLPKEKLEEFCRKHHIRSLSLFGSRLHGEGRETSDVDLLVEFDPEHVPGFFRLVEMEEELSGLLGGVKVDLRTPMDLSRYFRDEVLSSREVLYVES